MNNVFKIVKDNKKSLRLPSANIVMPLEDKYRKLGLDMLEYLKMSQDPELAEKYHLRPGVGLAAPQIGINKKIIAVYESDIVDGKKEVINQFILVNPKIVSESVKMCALSTGEGCLSVDKDHEGYVYRHLKIVVQAFDILTNDYIEITASGYLSIVLQHEIDHLNGILFYDRIDKKQPFKQLEGATII